jgi:Tol biopolymer transport system component
MRRALLAGGGLLGALGLAAAGSIASGPWRTHREDHRPPIVFVAVQDGAPSIWETGDRGLRRLTPAALQAFSPAWDRCGARLAFVVRAGEEFTINLLEGGKAQRIGAAPGPVSSLAWAPDGQHLYFVAREAPAQSQVLVSLDVASGQERVLLRRSEATIGQLSVNPRSGELAFSELGGDQSPVIRFVDPATGRVDDRTEAGASPGWSPDGRSLALVRTIPGGWALAVAGDRGDREVLRSERLVFTPAWSSDGATLYFERYESDSPSVWQVESDGRAARAALQKGGDTRSPAPQPACTDGAP